MTLPYRVLLVDLAQAFGGAEVRVLTTAQALQDRTEKGAVAVLENSLLHQRLQKEGLPCVVIGSGRASPRLLLELSQHIRQGGFNMVDAHNVQSILWGHAAALLGGARGRVATIHSDFSAEYPGLKGKVYEAVLRADQLMAQQFICVTDELRQKLSSAGLATRTTFIPNAVPVPDTPLQQPDRLIRTEWGFAPDDFVVGILARLKPVKGHTYLLDALAELNDLPKLKLVIVGDGPLLAELQAKVQSLGIQQCVHFTGFREDIPAILRSLDVACLASLSEALPYAVLEAAAYARPLLVTEVGGLRELLVNKQTALLVPPKDSHALATGLRWLYEHPDETLSLGLAAYQMVREKFSVNSMLDKVLQVYQQALS